MADERNRQADLEEYIRQGEPEQTEKTNVWKTAIGLQDVDGLKTSEYLLDTAKEHIEGKITIESAKSRIMSYYEQRSDRRAAEDGTREADIVSVRIAEMLSERTFQFSPAQLLSIHRRLFEGVFKHAGQFRTYNIIKKEWVLNGKSVFYASYDSIRESLDYDFGNEKEFSYSGIGINESVRHIAKFTSDIWQIHPFCEGNTRTTAVFILKYLQTFGFNVSNDVFADNSWYFRNALVRANYNDLKNDIHETLEYLEMFFDNLILGQKNELKNRYLHVDYSRLQSANPEISKCKNCTLDCTLEELAILNAIKNDPGITQTELAAVTGKSLRTVKTRTVELQEKGLIMRENGKRNGKWIVRSGL